jgi:hypothetical protein
MNRIRPLFVASVILALATLLPVAVFSVEPSVVPEPGQATSQTIVNVNGDPAALAAICERVAAGETVERVVYDCSALPAFQIVCTDPERSSTDCFPDATPVPNTCWDCLGSTYTWAEARVWYCTAERAQQEPWILDECWPEKWEWVCFPLPPDGNGNCEMYRRDLDPLGIFATPAPMPTPEPLPTPVPTATPDPTPELTPEPEPESTATPTP